MANITKVISAIRYAHSVLILGYQQVLKGSNWKSDYTFENSK